MTNTDRLWRRWVNAADVEALGKLFDHTAPELRRLARFLTSDPEAADDALQSTFLAVLERPRDLGNQGRVEAWLVGILVRQIQRQHKERARDRRSTSSEEWLAAASKPELSPVGQLSGEEFRVRVTSLIEGLPAGYAEPLRRQLLCGESALSIAQDLGLSAGTVHARVSRGMKKLRRLIPASLATPALGQGTAEAPQPALAELRSRLLETAKRAEGSALKVVAAETSIRSLVMAACAAGLAAVGIGWSLARSPTSPPALMGTVAPLQGGTIGDVPVASIDAVAVATGGRLAIGTGNGLRTRASAHSVGLDTAEPVFDLAMLATPVALLIDENTDRPLANAICRVTDVNGISIIAETDAKGSFLTDEGLLKGLVSLAVMGPAEKRKLRVLERHGRPSSYGLDGAESLSVFLHKKEGLRHSGNPAVPDRWRAGEKRWVPLECAGAIPGGASVEVVLVSSAPASTFECSWPQDPEGEGLQGILLQVSDDAFPLVFEARQARFVARLHRHGVAPELPPWCRQRVDKTLAGRVVRGVQFLESGVLVAEADASVVPHLYELPIRLEFAPLVDPEAGRILALYGTALGQRILRHVLPNDPAIEQSRTVRGIVTSDSGEFRGRVDVVATTPVLQIWTAGVTWKQEGSGAWVGTFEFVELSEGPHHLTVSAGSQFVVDPRRATATPPHEFERGSFVVRDLLPDEPAALRVRGFVGARILGDTTLKGNTQAGAIDQQ